MSELTREQLHAYLDDALDDTEMAAIEKTIRETPELNARLKQVRDERDRGEHSLGAVWRRDRLSCTTREQLTAYLHGILEADVHNYIDFHLKTIGCVSCLANLEDLKDKQAENSAKAKRRRRYFESSAGMLNDRK
jgi:hypothetical protein